ncbi:NAD-dependent dehydratase [Halocalculus aciditolerans]|uniref:NAD-dependent dehydratase n=1 Tax=Halocalculus aciditolerans TaxID=1383812 RepID=A0A830FM11_9EURY|nr:NAD-dependent dehydratase [Halocalculus aciditolerans]
MLDDFSLSDQRNLMGLSLDDVEFHRGDIRDESVVEDAMAGVDGVIHLAAVTGAAKSHDIRDRVMDVNVGGTEVVADAAEAAAVDTFVLASSCNVYGDTYEEELTEESEPMPGNPYAESKLECEDIVAEREFHDVSLRLATNFGYSPGVRFNLVVNSFVFRALAGEPLTVYGDGTNWRPFLHVQDTARAFEAALDWDAGTYNVGLGNFQIEEIADVVSDELDRPVETAYRYERDPGPSYHVRFEKMRDAGFEPQTGLAAGVRELAGTYDPAHRIGRDTYQ